MKNLRKLFLINRKERWCWYTIILYSVVVGIIDSFGLVHLLKEAIDDLLNGGNRKNEILLSFFVLLLIRSVLSFIERKSKLSIYISFVNTIEKKIIYNIYYVDANKEKQGDIFSLIQNTIPKFIRQYVDIYMDIWSVVITIIILTIYTAKINIYAVLICYLVSTIGIFLMKKSNKKIEANAKKCAESFNSVYSEMVDLFSCYEMFPYLNNTMFSLLERRITENEKNQINLSKNTNLARICMRFSSVGIMLIASTYLGILNILEKFPLASTFVLITLLPTLTNALFNLPHKFAEYKTLTGTAKYIYDFLSIKCEKEDNWSKLSIKQITEIEMSKILFSYDKTKFRFRVDEIKLKKGKSIGISGISGSGKTTFLQLLLHDSLYYKGNIKINGHKLKDISQEMLWDNVIYLPQEPIILPLSIEENIALCNKDEIDYEELEKAIKLADLSSFRKDNINCHTINKETISKGEIQKICLARVFYSKKSVFILDEATNALSPKVEYKIIKNLLNEVKRNDKILFIVSHNEEIISMCDYNMSIQKVES